jgi:phytoene dehydrogenase-like protein
MDTQYDAIIIGGGHNGLVTAVYLARSGQHVLVLEQRPVLGGAAATEEIWPGFRVNTGATDAGLFQEAIVKDLFLKMHGLEFRASPAAVFAPSPTTPLTLWRDEAPTVAEIARHSARDAAQYPAFVRQVERFTAVLQTTLLQTPPDLLALDAGDVAWAKVGWQLKRLGNQAMMEFMRVLPLAASEYLDEWFESDALKGALGLDAVTGNQLGPRSAGLRSCCCTGM